MVRPSRRPLGRVLLLLLAGAAASCGGGGAGDVRVLRGPTMGSSYEVKWHGPVGARAVAAAVEAELAAADRTFSQWRPDSELMRFNAQRSREPFPASELLRQGVRRALGLAEATGGAFDPTVKPLSDLYRARKRAPAAAIDAAAVAAARAKVGYARLHVRGEALVKDAPDLEIDLDGLVAGLCADRIGARLCALGVPGFMLQITGEVLCHGHKPGGEPWRIGITDPERAGPGGEAELLDLPVLDRALCTSGGYRNYVVQDGRVYTHVFDPRTGDNPAHGVVGVSVLARSCALADGLGTALMVTGPGPAAALLARCGEPDAGAFFVLADGRGGLRRQAVHWPTSFAPDGRPLFAPAPAAAGR